MTLVGWWPLHGTSGDAVDLSGNGNNGTVNGATRGVAGKGGLQAMSFDGSNDYVGVTGPTYSASDDLTLMAWVKTSTNNYGDIIQCDVTSGDTYLFLQRGTSGVARLTAEGDTTTTNDAFNGSTTITDGNWHLVAGVWNGSQGEGRIYIDGKLDVEGSISTSGNITDTTSWSIGGNNNWYSGTISDARLYDRALTQQEILQLYQWGRGDYAAPPGSSDSGALSYYTFNSSNGNDKWGNNDGTVSGATYVSDGGPRNNGAYSYDGSDDYFDTGIGSISVPFTIGCWVKPDRGNSSGTYPRLFDKYNNTSEDFYLYDNSGTWEFAHDFGTNVNGSTVLDAEWQHISVTFSSDNLRIYQNGVMEDEVTGYTGTFGNSVSLKFMRRADGTFDILAGQMSNIRIYTRALSPREIHQIYRYGTRGRDMRQVIAEQ